MFCCIPRSGGTGLRKPWCGCLIGAWRRWISAHPRLQRLRPFSSRNPNETNGSTAQMYSVQNENKSVPTQERSRRVSTVEPDMLEKMVSLLVPLHQKEDPFFVPAFLFTYRRFTTTGQVLDLLFQSTMCSMLAMWLDKYPEDFCQTNNLSNLNKLMAYVLLNMPTSELAVRVHHLLTELEEQEVKEADKKREEFLAPAPEIEAEDLSVMAADVVLKSAAPSAAEEDPVPLQDSMPHVVVVQYVSSI
ncbi:uncharacterized protein RHO17_012050 isoform 2-T2 [Thomomys bottae]